jgi:hypothetical protein
LELKEFTRMGRRGFIKKSKINIGKAQSIPPFSHMPVFSFVKSNIPDILGRDIVHSKAQSKAWIVYE